MALKFFSVLKANAEISRLETELASMTQRATALESAEPENLAALQDELTDTKSKLTAAQVELGAANELAKSFAEKDAEIAKLKADAVALEASVEARASEKALTITQSQGQAKPVKPENKEQKTISRAEFTALNPSEQSTFCRNGGKITN